MGIQVNHHAYVSKICLKEEKINLNKKTTVQYLKRIRTMEKVHYSIKQEFKGNMEENETMPPTSEAQWTLEKCDSRVDENSKLTRENEAETDSPSKNLVFCTRNKHSYA